jgi:hypothetical protein
MNQKVQRSFEEKLILEAMVLFGEVNATEFRRL